MLRVALALVSGLALGVAIGWFASPTPIETAGIPAAAAPVAASVATATPRAPENDTRTLPESQEAQGSRQPASGEVFTRSLLALADEGVRAGWRTRRPDTIPDHLHKEGLAAFEEAVLTLPVQIGARLADEQTAREEALADAQAGGAFALLAALARDGTPVPDLVTNAKAFEALLPRNRAGPTVHAESMLGKLADVLEDGATLSFPAGVFELRRLLGLKTPFPDEVTLTGAGMNATLFVLDTDWTARSPVRRLEVRDCTIFTDNNYLVDQREGEFTMALERVRVLGTDSGAGGSGVVSLRGGGVMRARDCRFEGGYGRSPGGAAQLFIFRTPAPVAARFERCTVSRMHLSIEGLKSGTTIAFDNCRLDEMFTFYPASAVFADPPAGLILASGTTVTLFEGDRNEVPKLDLNDLFPDWKQRLVRE